MARVLLLASYAPSLVNFRGALLREWLARGHEVFAAAPPPEGGEAMTVSTLRSWGVQWLPLPFARNRIDPIGDAAMVLRLTGLLRRHRIEQMLSYTLKPNVFGAAAAAAAGVRSAGMVTGLGSVLLGRGFTRRVAEGLLRAAGRQHRLWFVQNFDDREDLVRMGVAPREAFVRTMGSGVDLERFAPLPMPPRPAVLMLSRLLADKGIRSYLRAAERLRTTHPDLPLRLAGMQDAGSGGVPLAEIHASPVEYLGALADVRPELARASIYALPSHHEGTPRSVLEAMACGRAIVTSDARGCRETVWPGENGLRVPVGNARALAEAIARLADDPKLCARMGARSLELAREHFDAKVVARQISDALGL